MHGLLLICKSEVVHNLLSLVCHQIGNLKGTENFLGSLEITQVSNRLDKTLVMLICPSLPHFYVNFFFFLMMQFP